MVLLPVGASNSSFVSGPIKKVGNTSFDYPLGGNGNYKKLSISAPGNVTDAFTAQYFSSGIYQNEPKDVSLNYVAKNYYWEVNRNTGSSNVYVYLSWNDIEPVVDTNIVRIAKWNGTQWSNEGNSSTSGNTGNGSTRTTSVNSSFGIYTLASIPLSTIDCSWATNQSIPDVYFNFDAGTGVQFASEPLTPTVGVTHSLSSLNAIPVKNLSPHDNSLDNETIPLTNITSNYFSTTGFDDYMAIELMIKFDKKNCSNQRSLELFRFGPTGSFAPGAMAVVFNLELSQIEFFTSSGRTASEFVDDMLIIPLTGIDRRKLDYYFDDNWHHFVFVFDAGLAHKEMWVDGQLNDEFEKDIFDADNNLFDNADVYDFGIYTPILSLNNNFGVSYDLNLALYDEIAIYKTQKICPEQIKYHSENVLINGSSHYTFNVSNLSGYGNTPQSLAGTMNPNDFPDEYSIQTTFPTLTEVSQGHYSIPASDVTAYNTLYNDVKEPVDQLKTYALPRFKPGHNFQPNVNWMGSDYLGYRGFMQYGGAGGATPNVPLNDAVSNAVEIQKQLAEYWNYSFTLCENTKSYNEGSPELDFNSAFINVANSYPSNSPIKFSLKTFRGQLPTLENPAPFPGAKAAVKYQHYFPDKDYYLMKYDGNTFPDDDNFLTLSGAENGSDKLWNPASEISTYDADGAFQKSIFTNMFGSGSASGAPPIIKNIYHITENNEYTPQFKIETTGPPINLDKVFSDECNCGDASSGHIWLSERKKDLDNNYRDQFYDATSFPKLSSAMYLNYAVDGRDNYGDYFRYLYSDMRLTNSQIGSTGKYLATPDFYPMNPSKWNPTVGDRHGIQWMNESRKVELNPLYGDDRYAPFICAGWNHFEENNIRPAQYLGLLKSIGIMGLDFFHSSFFNLGDINIAATTTSWWQHPKGFVWQASTPVYVQAMYSRAQSFFSTGFLLEGDINLKITDPTLGFSYKFKDSPNSLIMVRGNSATTPTELLITGSIQPISNVQNNTDDSRIASISVYGTDLKFEIRRQGSTYIYNYNGGTPIFYQLDKWHESSHPDLWTKDFYFEAELYDNAPSSVNIVTKSLTNTTITNGDYSAGFDTYVTTTSEALEYRFTPRDNSILPTPVNNDYEIYVRANRLSAGSGNISIGLNASDNSQNFSTIITGVTNSGFAWYKICTSGANFSGLNPDVEFILSLLPSTDVAIDAVYLDYSDGNYFPVDLTAVTPVASSEPTLSISSTLLCGGNRNLTASGIQCATAGTNYSWSTGASTATITGVTPGTYTVTISGSGFTTTSASINFAGPASVNLTTSAIQNVCTGSPGGLGTAQVLVTGGTAPYTYLWSNSQTTPTASGLNASTYTVTVTDANSCTYTSTVTPTSIAPTPLTVTPATANIDFAKATILDATTGFVSYSWAPTYWINNPYTEDPVVKPEANQIYTLTAVDGNGCISQATADLTINTDCGTYLLPFPATGPITGEYNLNSNLTLTDNLTINSSNIAIAPDIIIDTDIYTLTIINSQLFACGDMWNGIFQDNSAGKIIITNSNIKDAKTAVYAEEGTVEINGTIFNHNFTSIELSNHDFSVSGTDNTFYGNKFKNSNSEISKAPHIGEDPDQHILITDVDEVEIGISNSAIDPNVFSNSLVGIKSLNSNTVVLNNDFRNIGDNNFQERYSQINFIVPPNAAIWSQGVSSGSSGSISVGDDTDDGKNTFSNCESGIYATINTGVSVTKNNFSNNMIGIRLEQLQDNSVSIQRNVMDDFIDGISLFNVSGDKSVEIRENDLNMNQTFDEEEFEYVSTEYSNNGINLDASAPTLLDYTIRDNEIQNCRFGIALNGIAPGSRFYPSTINIYDNEINYYIQRADLSSNENYGIWLQNSRRTYIYGNTITWFHEPIAGDEELITGITLSNSTANEIGENEIISLGSGINIMGDCSRSNFYCNEFRNNFHGIFLNGNGVNSRITRQGNAEIFTGDLQAWKNEWINNVDADEIAGNSSFAAQWLYYNNGGANPEFEPTSGIVNIAPFSVGESISGCYTATYYELISMRTADFGIKDSMFDHPDSVLISYYNNETYYLLSNLDTTILYTGNSVDSIYINAFDTLLTNNIGRLNDVLTMIIARDLVAAQDTLDVIIPNNEPEENMIFVLNTYLKFLNETIEDEDIDQLRTLAYEHPFYSGRAVYIARVLLNIKVIDYLEGLRIGNSAFLASSNSKEEEKFTQIYPNPNRGELVVRILNKDAFYDCDVIVYDITGRILMKTSLSEPISSLLMPNLQPGSYLIEILGSNSLRDIHRFEIIH
jgi:hypothetical protein